MCNNIFYIENIQAVVEATKRPMWKYQSVLAFYCLNKCYILSVERRVCVREREKAYDDVLCGYSKI